MTFPILDAASAVALWLLIGFTTGVTFAFIIVLSAFFSRDLKRGITTTISESLFEGLGTKKELFLTNLEKELARRGTIPRKPLEKDIDLIYRDFFDEVKVFVSQEDSHLRYGFQISARARAIALGVILLIPLVIGSVLVFSLALLRRNNTQRTFVEAGQSAALFSSTRRESS